MLELFWFILVVEIILLLICVKLELDLFAAISLIVFAVILNVYCDVNIISFIKSNPVNLIMIVGSYVVIGVMWSVFKWWMFVRDRRSDYEKFKSAWLLDRGCDSKHVPDDLKESFRNHLADKNRFKIRIFSSAPSAADHKDMIIRWLAFWPISVIWSIANDFIKWLFDSVVHCFRFVYNRIAVSLQIISDSIYKSVDDL